MGGAEVLAQDFFFNIERFYMYVCFNGGGGAYAIWKIFQPFGHGILLEEIGLVFCE